jgi:hypothetical protein
MIEPFRAHQGEDRKEIAAFPSCHYETLAKRMPDCNSNLVVVEIVKGDHPGIELEGIKFDLVGNAVFVAFLKIMDGVYVGVVAVISGAHQKLFPLGVGVKLL